MRRHAARFEARRPRPSSPGFTLTELMVAVVMLVAVMLAVGKIFQTTREVTSIGEASADVLQEAATIERLWREDISNLSQEGVFLIRCVAVPNDLYGNDNLLNPALPPDEYLRSDQLLFFTTGIEGSNVFGPGAGTNQKGQGVLNRIYYGHGFQLGPDVDPYDPDDRNAHDPYEYAETDEPAWTNLTPWTKGEVQMAKTNMVRGNQIFSFSGFGDSNIQMPQTDARNWVLVRQPILMVDDDRRAATDRSKTQYMTDASPQFSVMAGRSIFKFDPFAGESWQVQHGRVDAAATQLDDLRRILLFEDTGTNPVPRPWLSASTAIDDQRDVLRNSLLYYPRAERFAPSTYRADQALTTSVLGAAVSQVAIDWTWDEGTGETNDAVNGRSLKGFRIPDPSLGRNRVDQVWFGMPGANFPVDMERGVGPLGNSNHIESGFFPPESVSNNNAGLLNTIEDLYTYEPSGAAPGKEVAVYEAFFGMNQTRSTANSSEETNSYTPWPSAIRVTLTLHDENTNLELGREVQFVIDLPDRMPGTG